MGKRKSQRKYNDQSHVPHEGDLFCSVHYELNDLANYKLGPVYFHVFEEKGCSGIKMATQINFYTDINKLPYFAHSL